jgi:HAE1 family hydrophobic/amphiphilic exporter-1
MLENIVRHVEQGETPFEAAIKGAREIGFTIVSMTISLIAVFIPVLFMSGIVGRLLHEFAVTICVAILVSGFVSLTLTPMLCSRLHQARVEPDSHGRLFQAFERFFAALLAAYERHLKAGHGAPADACWRVSFATLLLTGLLFAAVPKEFLPSGDSGRIIAFTEGAQDVSFASMVATSTRAGRNRRPGTRHPSFMSAVGAGGIRPTANTGTIFMILKPARRTSLVAGRDHSAPAPQAGGSAGHQGLPAESAGDPHRRPADRRAVPVHPAGHRPRSSSTNGPPP